MDRKKLIATRLQAILKDLKSTPTPTLIAVSKACSLADIEWAFACGQRHFGENRVEQLASRMDALAFLPGIRWHFIGNLQSNKIKKLFAVKNLTHIHSVKSIGLLEKMYANCDMLESTVEFFLQVNTSEEKEKAGFANKDELCDAANLIDKQGSLYPQLVFKGLMTMSKIRTENFAEDARICFKELREYRDFLQRDFNFPPLKLSMGMSADYKWALEEGADYIRVGSAIFS